MCACHRAAMLAICAATAATRPASASDAAAAGTCRLVRTMEPFNVSQFAGPTAVIRRNDGETMSAPGSPRKWYVQAQQPITGPEHGPGLSMPGPDGLYCTTVEYVHNLISNIFNHHNNYTSIGVMHRWNTGEVNVNVTDGGGGFEAVIENPELPSKLSFGASELPTALYGPYWVIAVGSSSSDGAYDWAVISGGQPSKVSPPSKCGPDHFELFGKCRLCPIGGCGTLCENGNNAGVARGLWVLSRSPEMPEQQLKAVIENHVGH